MAKQVTFKEIGGGEKREGPEGVSVDTVLNKPLVVTKVEVVDGYQGQPLLLVYTSNEGIIRSGSGILLEQAGRIKKSTDAGEEVKTTIVRIPSKKNPRYSYYSFQ